MAELDASTAFDPVVENVPTSNWDDSDNYEDGFEEDDDDELFGTPPEYSHMEPTEGRANGRYANLEEHSIDNTKTYLDYNPGIFDDDVEGIPTPPDSGRNVPQFNTDEAQEIADKLNNLIDSRSGDSSSNSVNHGNSISTGGVENLPDIPPIDNDEHDSKGPATSPTGAVPDAVVAAGSALSAVRTRSGGSEVSSKPLIDVSVPSDKALRSYQQAMERGEMHSADSTGGRGGLNHRQTLRALKAKKEIILSAKRQQPAGASNVVVEGETPVDLGNSSLGGSGQETVRSANKRGPMVRQILRRKTAKELKAEAEEAAKAEETEEEKEIRRQAHKARKAKMAEMLAKLQQAKADEAEERRKKEAAQRRRKAILTARVMAEAAERTSMCREDKPRYRALALEKAKNKGKDEQVVAPKKKEKSGSEGAKKPPFGFGSSSKKEDDKDTLDAADESDADVADRSAKKGKISHTQSDALYNRLTARQLKTSEGVDLVASQSVPVRDFADWKRKNNVPSDGLVFAMTGWYPCVKQALLDRGWYFNPDADSPYFDLKWTLRALQTAQETLQSWQLTNHFLKNMAITTKVGLLKSLRSLVWLADVSCNDVIPRGYDLSNDMEMQAFIDDYRLQHAENILKRLYMRVVGISFPPRDIDGDYDGGDEPLNKDSGRDGNDDDVDENKEVTQAELVSGQDEIKANFCMPITPRPQTADGIQGSGGATKINVAVFETCCDVLERYLRPTHDTYIDTEDDDSYLVYNRHAAMSSLQWEILENTDIHAAYNVPDEVPEGVDAFLPGNEHMLQAQEQGGGTANTAAIRSRKGAQDRLEGNKSNAQLQRQARANEKREKALREEMRRKALDVRTISSADISRMHKVLNRLYCHDRNQSGLNGAGDVAKNIWIVKPGAKSRGRGICTFADLSKLLKYVDAGTGSAQSSQWVVQKYMENPLCVANHKFDLRQWVLVTDWNPLTVWFYDECYARFSVEPYTTDDSALENSYVHLVNNSISKQSEEFKKLIKTENGEHIHGYMWSHEQMGAWMKHQTGRDLMEEKIKPRMMDIAKWSLMCASECIEHRKNSWELYGFDFMVDENYNTWLIEINSSPACDYSTPTTERYVQKALVELLSVTLDMREWESKSSKKRGKKPDTGGWSCIHKGPLLEMPTAAFGADMSLKGDAMKVPKRRGSITGPPVVPFSNSAKRAASVYSQKSNTQTQLQSATGSIIPPSSPKAESSTSSAPRAARSLRPAKARAVGVWGSNNDEHDISRDVVVASGANASMDASLMNDSVSLASLNESMSVGTLDDSDDESDAEKASRNVKKVLRAHAKAQAQIQEEDQVNAGFGSPLAQQILSKRAQARNEAKFRLDLSPGVGSASAPVPIGEVSRVLSTTNINFASPKFPAAAASGDVENAALTIMNSGGSLERERELTLQQRRQLKEIRSQKAASSKIAAVPPVGRDSAAIKAKVFEMPF